MWKWLSEIVRVVYHNISHRPPRTLRKCYTRSRAQGVFSQSRNFRCRRPAISLRFV